MFGLQMGLFTLGEALAHAFVRKGNVFALLVFAFALGFGTTIAEPALIAVAGEAAAITADDDEYGLFDFGGISRQVLAKDRSPDSVNIYGVMTKPTIKYATEYGHTILRTNVRAF